MRSTLSHLAARLGVNASSAQRQVDRLLALDLVARREDAEDRRQVRLRLTRAAERLVDRVVRHRRAAIARIVADMPEEHRGGLVDALTSFADAAGDLLPSDPAARLGW